MIYQNHPPRERRQSRVGEQRQNAPAQATDPVSAQAQKPNILFILTDNLGYGEIGVYGGGATRGAPTPRIDKIASEGFHLTNMNMETRWGSEARLAAYRPREAKLPLSLISPASDKRISSTLLGLGGKPGEAPPLLINPVDATARGLENVKRIRVWNELGNVVLPLIISDAVPPGVVASEEGRLARHQRDRTDN